LRSGGTATLYATSAADAFDQIKNPPIEEFVHKFLPQFLGTNIARVTNGARKGKFLIIHAVAKEGGYIVLGYK